MFEKMKRFLFDEVSEEVEVEVDEKYENGVVDEEEEELSPPYTKTSSISNVVNFHNTTNMKVVIVEPKSFDEVTLIADHLRQNKAVIVNLESMENEKQKKPVFDFMSGAVYVLEGDIQRVAKGIYILAPKNVNIDSTIKKELESKARFPWQNK